MQNEFNQLKVTGLVKQVSPVHTTKSGSTFQQILIEQLYNKYPNKVAFTVWDHHVHALKEGEVIEAYLSIETKLASDGVWFNSSIKAWRFNIIN